MKPATEKQMWAIRQIIITSQVGSEFGKKAMLLMLEQSEMLTKGVDLCLTSKKKRQEIIFTVRDMKSSGYDTQISKKMDQMGVCFKYSYSSTTPYGCVILHHRAKLFPATFSQEVDEAKKIKTKKIKSTVAEIEKVSLTL